ncbi:hypothetical protein [Sphingomonas sp. UYP23]
MDKRLGDNGIDGAALHEVAPGAPSLSDDAAAAPFVAGIAARFAGIGDGRGLWAVSRFDLYAPGLEQAGLPPGGVSSSPRVLRTTMCSRSWRTRCATARSPQ